MTTQLHHRYSRLGDMGANDFVFISSAGQRKEAGQAAPSRCRLQCQGVRNCLDVSLFSNCMSFLNVIQSILGPNIALKFNNPNASRLTALLSCKNMYILKITCGIACLTSKHTIQQNTLTPSICNEPLPLLYISKQTESHYQIDLLYTGLLHSEHRRDPQSNYAQTAPMYQFQL